MFGSNYFGHPYPAQGYAGTLVPPPPPVPADPVVLRLRTLARTAATLTDEALMTLLLTDTPRVTLDLAVVAPPTATLTDEARTTVVLTDEPRMTLTLTDGPPQDVNP